MFDLAFSPPPRRDSQSLPIVRCNGTAGLRAVVASYRAVGVWTHWDQDSRRKLLCGGGMCEHCGPGKRPPIWYGYMLIQREDGSGLAVLEVTPSVAQELEVARDRHGENADLVVQLKRESDRPGSRLRCHFFPVKIEHSPNLGASREILPRVLTALYRGTQSSDNGITRNGSDAHSGG